MQVAMLRSVPLFAGLPEGEITRLAAKLRSVDVPSQTTLVREGEPGDHFYIILTGQFEIVKAPGGPDERRLGLRGPGEFVGEMSLLNPDGLRTATVRACTAGQVLEMTRADFDGLLSRQPSFAYDLARNLSAQLQAANIATIRDLQHKNREVVAAYHELQAAQAQLVEKEALERELQMARTIQESILPQSMPSLMGFDVSAMMLPARVVGGDFFDFIPLAGARLGVVVGDISGKGMPAAIFMALTRSLLRAEASRGAPPRTVLEEVNRHLLDMNQASMFATVVYGVLDLTTRQFAYARAAHELPILVDTHGTITEIGRSSGHPLGILPEPDIDEQTVMLAPGSLFLMYSDGVTDAVDPRDNFYGLEQLQLAVRAHCDMAAQTLVERLLALVQAHQDTASQADDITLVVVHAE